MLPSSEWASSGSEIESVDFCLETYKLVGARFLTYIRSFVFVL